MNVKKKQPKTMPWSAISRGDVFLHPTMGLCMRIHLVGEYHAVQLETGNLCVTNPESGMRYGQVTHELHYHPITEEC